jgi:hypothetical protein
MTKPAGQLREMKRKLNEDLEVLIKKFNEESGAQVQSVICVYGMGGEPLFIEVEIKL